MDRDSHVRWLLARLPELVAEGVLSPDGPSRLAEHFAADDDGASRAAGQRVDGLPIHPRSQDGEAGP